MTTYIHGEKLRLTATFTDEDDAVVDPTVVTCQYQTITAGVRSTITSLVYGTSAAVVKDSTGVYHVDLTLGTADVVYAYAWTATGTAVAANDGEFAVRSRKVA